MLTCETVNRVFYRQRRFCTEHQSHLTHPSVQRLMFWGHSQMKRVRAERKWKMRHLKAGTYRELPRERAANWSKTRNPPLLLQLFRDMAPALTRVGGGNWWKQEMFSWECKWTRFSSPSGPQRAHTTMFLFFFVSFHSINHIAPSAHPSTPPSVHPSIHLSVALPCQVFPYLPVVK